MASISPDCNASITFSANDSSPSSGSAIKYEFASSQSETDGAIAGLSQDEDSQVKEENPDAEDTLDLGTRQDSANRRYEALNSVKDLIEGSLSDSEYAIACLEDLSLSFLAQLVDATPGGDSPSHKGKVEILLANRKGKGNNTNSQPSIKRLTIPSRRIGGTRSLACLLDVVNACHEALVTGVAVTKRDIYYKNPSLFGKQSVVDTFVDDLAATFGLSRSDLNVRASSKGLFAGSALTIALKHGGCIAGNDRESCLIPCNAEVERLVIRDDLSWVLVVEKEAVFQTLCSVGFCSNTSLKGPGVILTGKGYPDLATREILNVLASDLPEHIPIMALVDADPHGLEIYLTYKLGSASMNHQNQTLVAPRLEWIGVFFSELSSLGVARDDLIPTTKADVRKGLSMLSKNPPTAIKRELSHMLFTRRKAEIEVLCCATVTASLGNMPGALECHPFLDYLQRKVNMAINLHQSVNTGGQRPVVKEEAR